MTKDVLQFVVVFVVGTGLGLFYFGGLWLTVQRLPVTKRLALLTLGSLVGRMGISLFGFYLVMDGQWERLLVCLSGFVLVRVILVRRWGPGRANIQSTVREGSGCGVKF